MSEILNKTITITEATEEAKRIKVKDEKNLTYSIWKTKSDGSESVAYMYWQKMPNKFQTIHISYTEQDGDYQGKPLKYRSIIGFKGSHEIFQPAQQMETKISNDKAMRESFKDDLQDRIRWGNAGNMASSLAKDWEEAKELMPKIYEFLGRVPKEENPLMPDTSTEAINEKIQEVIQEQDDIDISQIPF